MKCPYSFPARSREAMIKAMEDVGGYSTRHSGGYPFAWNVKIHRYPSTARELAEHAEGEPFNPAWDDAWEREMESDDSFFWSICENMARHYLEGDYSTWPGDDSGEFAFSIAGRSGGWLILESAYGWNMRGFDLDSLRDVQTPYGIEESDWTFAEVRKLYKAIMVMEADFASDKIQREYAYQVAFRRTQWEEERRETIRQLDAEAASDKATALRLLSELRAMKRLPALAPFKESCAVLRKAIVTAIGDRRDSIRQIIALVDGVEL